MRLDPPTYTSTTDTILAYGGHYKLRIKRLVRSTKIHLYGIEQERVDLVKIRKQLEYWLNALQELTEGNYLGWHFPSTLQKLQDSEQRLQELKIKYIGKSLKVPKQDHRRQLCTEEVVRRVGSLVKELRDFWISASIRYTEAVARSSSSMKERKLRCHGVVDFDA